MVPPTLGGRNRWSLWGQGQTGLHRKNLSLKKKRKKSTKLTIIPKIMEKHRLQTLRKFSVHWKSRFHTTSAPSQTEVYESTDSDSPYLTPQTSVPVVILSLVLKSYCRHWTLSNPQDLIHFCSPLLFPRVHHPQKAKEARSQLFPLITINNHKKATDPREPPKHITNKQNNTSPTHVKGLVPKAEVSHGK